MKITIQKNNFENKEKTFSYTRGRGDDGGFYSFKTVGFVFVVNDVIDIDIDSLAYDESDFGKTYIINNSSVWEKALEALDNSFGVKVVIKNKVLKASNFPDFKNYSPEDGRNTVWGYWADTEGTKYKGTVDPTNFKRNAVFSVEGVEISSKYGTQIEVSSIDIRKFNLNKPEFFLKGVGFSSINIQWALDHNIYDMVKNIETKHSGISSLIEDAIQNKEVVGIGKITFAKIIKNIKAARKEMGSVNSIDSITKFKSELRDLFVESRVQGFWNKTEISQERYLEKIHKGFTDIISGGDFNGDFKKKFGIDSINDVVGLIKKNPYILILLPNHGFKTVDIIARDMGVEVSSLERQEACVNGILNGEIQGGFGGNGDIYLDRESLFNELVEELAISDDGFIEEFTQADSDKLFLSLRENGSNDFYHWMHVDENGKLTEKFTNSVNYENEEVIFDTIKQALETSSKWNNPIKSKSNIEQWIAEFEHRESATHGVDYKLSAEQKKALYEINSNDQPIFCMTGFAGTGKSTVSKAILELLAIENKDELGQPSTMGIECLAVSGMASRRINEATGFHSTTITSYLFNPKRVASTKVLFIDEASMVDSETMATLLKKIDAEKVKIVLVGDVGQLPPIGRGTPFKDILDSGWVRNVQLKKIFRQDDNAVLTTFAKSMRNENVDEKMYKGDFSDFCFKGVDDRILYKIRNEMRPYEDIENPTPKQKEEMRSLKGKLHKALNLCNSNIKQEVANLIYQYKSDFKSDFTSFQLISPQKTTIVGTDSINLLAQDILNDTEIPFMDGDISIGMSKKYKRFKINDKVIHTKNENWFLGDNLGFFKDGKIISNNVDAEIMGSKYCHPVGGKKSIRILNGMVGIIHSYDQLMERITVKYRYEDTFIAVEYQKKDLGSLHLGYCLTIHKLQGSEAKTIGLIVSPSHVRMINNNLLYTGITRGKTKGFILGSEKAFKQGLKKHGTIRQTMLPLLFNGLFWDLDNIAQAKVMFSKDNWSHGSGEINKVKICGEKDDFLNLVG